MNKSQITIPRTVCVLRLSAIGDTCHVLPVIRTLQRAWPETRFSWVIGKLEATLMQGVSDVEFIIFDKRSGRQGLKALQRNLASREFDVLLHMNASMRANRVSRQIRAKSRWGFDRARARDFQWLYTDHRIAAAKRQHVMDGLFGFAEALGVGQRDLRWDIPTADADQAFAAAQRCGKHKLIVISPCSSQRARNFRNWPAERFAAVVDHVSRYHDTQVVLTGGATDLERRYAQAIVAASTHGKPVDLVGQTTLKQLYALITEADAVICPDSGPAHMATAAATPVVGLYASSNPMRTGPYLSQQWVVNKYPEAVRKAFGKPVDAIRWGRRVRDPHVMELIEVVDVTDKLDALLPTSPMRGV